MSFVLHIRFWISFAIVLGSLSLAGTGLAALILQTPPTYHRSTYLEFPLPAGWTCDREGTETVCSPPGPPPRSAIIIFTAKERAPDDNPQAYMEHLRQPSEVTLQDGTKGLSQVISVRENTIGNYRWIDGLHLGSELPNYFTRYLATTTAEIGVLVTFSVHKSRFDEYNPQLEQAIDGLDIYQKPTVAEAAPARVAEDAQ